MTTTNITFYDSNAEDCSRQYNSLSFEDVHGNWAELIPLKGAALDIGCGSGRDASALANRGLNVIGVDPSEKLLQLARTNFATPSIEWIKDSLPLLEKVNKLDIKFDLILLSAVWMHIPVADHDLSFRNLAKLLKKNGVLIITLRHGESPDERIMYPVNKQEIKLLANQAGLSPFLLNAPKQKDQLKRDSVHWETIVLRLADAVTGQRLKI